MRKRERYLMRWEILAWMQQRYCVLSRLLHFIFIKTKLCATSPLVPLYTDSPEVKVYAWLINSMRWAKRLRASMPLFFSMISVLGAAYARHWFDMQEMNDIYAPAWANCIILTLIEPDYIARNWGFPCERWCANSLRAMPATTRPSPQLAKCFASDIIIYRYFIGAWSRISIICRRNTTEKDKIHRLMSHW